METKELKRNIFQKMLMIQSELGVIAKNLDVQGKYKAVSERDVLDNVKKLEEKYGVYSYPHEREIIENVVTDKRIVMRVKTIYRFVNIDNPEEFIDIVSYGDGIDTMDKAPGKAMTYADKYALMKAYKISTGDDPDQYASPDKVQAAPAKMATAEQETKLKTLMDEAKYKRMLTNLKINSVRDIPYDQAQGYIEKLEKAAAANKKAKETEAKETPPAKK